MMTDAFEAQLDNLADAFGDQLLGSIEIGSRARGEAVRWSDHDIRIACAPKRLTSSRTIGDGHPIHRRENRYLEGISQVLDFHSDWAADLHAEIVNMYRLKADESRRNHLHSLALAKNDDARHIAQSAGQLVASLWRRYREA
jgi:hypothetical protein